jgi:SpoVK/Ycf46/Vps4 family AAA+-type ATPase
MGKVFSGLVGSSEQNMRQVFKVAESVAPCILWCDEIDKGMSGSRASSSTDGGTTSRVLGSWLTWMQDRKEPVFVVATANDVTTLPPELLRKGRFDEIFFVDLPKFSERRIIFEIHLQKRARNPKHYDLDKLSDVSESYTGAEIEAAIESALYEAFSDNKRDITTYDILQSLKESVPISKLMKEEIELLRAWASERARNASNGNSDLRRYNDSEDDL